MTVQDKEYLLNEVLFYLNIRTITEVYSIIDQNSNRISK